MQVILCLDDRNGMMFNHRRQSRDRAVIQDILENLRDKQLPIRPNFPGAFSRRKNLCPCGRTLPGTGRM